MSYGLQFFPTSPSRSGSSGGARRRRRSRAFFRWRHGAPKRQNTAESEVENFVDSVSKELKICI